MRGADGLYPVEVHRIDEVWGAEAGQPSENIPEGGCGTDCPGPQARADELCGNRVAGSTNTAVVEEEEDGEECHEDIAGRLCRCAYAPSYGHDQVAETTCSSTEHEMPTTTEQLVHGDHAKDNADETDTRAHDGKLEWLRDARNGKEVGLVGDEKPAAGSALGSNGSVAQQSPAEIHACEGGCQHFLRGDLVRLLTFEHVQNSDAFGVSLLLFHAFKHLSPFKLYMLNGY